MILVLIDKEIGVFVKTIFLIATLFYLFTLSACSSNPVARQTTLVINDPLFVTISELDTKVFNAFNNCELPQQLEEYISYFSSDIEFYHDSGGVTWTREAMASNTKNYVCGKFQRQLVPGSLKIYPIKDFGAISEGEHQFCKFGKNHCDGIAKFTIIWRKQENKWEISRVLSYGHRANN